MAIEKGVVIKMGAGGPHTAWVKTLQSSACQACASRKNCSTAERGQEREVEVINGAGAKVGDIIQIYMDTAALLKAAFLLYIFPIICMMIGGAAGHAVSNILGLSSSLLSVCLAIIFFIAAMVLVRIHAGRMALTIEYRPKIKRIIGHQKNESGDIQSTGDCTMNVASNI